MPIVITMPALSPTMTEGHVVKWHKQEGDRLRAGETLVEIETDKATMEVEVVDEGILFTILIPEGTQGISVGKPLAVLREDRDTEEQLQTYIHQLQEPQGGSTAPQEMPSLEVPALVQQAPQLQQEPSRIMASPLARKIADQSGIALETVMGTGPRGRIVRRDIEEAIAASAHRAPLMEPTTIPLTGMRRTIAKRLTESKQTIPHFYLSVECRVDDLLALRQSLNTALEDKVFSVNDFMVRACAIALEETPAMQGQWQDTHIVQSGSVDLAVAVSVEGGLVTPIIRAAATKSLRQLTQELKELIQRARAHQLQPQDYQGGTFTLTNLGMWGITSFQPIINPPQSGILAIGASVEKPIVDKGAIVIGSMMTVTLAADHRVVDGSTGAVFLQAFKRYVENPLLLVC